MTTLLLFLALSDGLGRLHHDLFRAILRSGDAVEVEMLRAEDEAAMQVLSGLYGAPPKSDIMKQAGVGMK